MRRLGDRVIRRGARTVTTLVVARPWLWRLLRGPFRRQWEELAAGWDARRSPNRTAAYEAALDRLPHAPRRALDVGTGTGDAAFAVARRFPETEVVGVDFASAMVEAARAKTPEELAARVEFVVGDAAALPFPDAAFDLVGQNNMIPFFEELARVTAPGGHVVVAFTLGAATPIYVPPERLRDGLSRRGFSDFAEISSGEGTALLAQRR